MRPWSPLLAGIAALLVAGCFEERSAGTSTETENAIGARKFRVDSVFPSTEAFPGETAVATLRLDSSSLEFAKTRPDGQDLEVVRMDGKPIPFEIAFWDREHSRGRVHVRLEPYLRVHGSHFLLRWGLPPAAREKPQEVWSGISESRKLDWNSVLVDDFESGNLLHSRLPDSSFWFFGGALTNSGLTAAGMGRNGNALHASCLAAQCDTKPALLTATMIARTRRSLRGLDSVEVWARGTGKLWIAFESLDSVQMGRMARGRIDSIQPLRAWASRTLTGDWQRHVVGTADFLPPDGTAANVGWAGVRDSINYITFLYEGGVEFWIDDVRLHGILKQDLE